MGVEVELAILKTESKTRDMNQRFKMGLISEDEWKEYMLSEDTMWNFLKEILPPLRTSAYSNMII